MDAEIVAMEERRKRRTQINKDLQLQNQWDIGEAKDLLHSSQPKDDEDAKEGAEEDESDEDLPDLENRGSNSDFEDGDVGDISCNDGD